MKIKNHFDTLKKNKTTLLMGVLNVIATIIIANGGYDLSINKQEISQNKDTIATLHKRITSQEVNIAKLNSQLDDIKYYLEQFRKEYREDILNVNIRIDRKK